MTAYELDPVEHIVADAVGEPGARTFLIQGRRGGGVVTVIVEKQQVAMLCELIEQLLARIGSHEMEPSPEPGDLSLIEPIAPAFRVGRIAIGYDAARDLVLLQCDEVGGEDADDVEDIFDEPEPSEGDRVRFWATRGQIRALALHGEQVVAAGRPTCRMCGEALEPGGHFCPPSNGHRDPGDISPGDMV